MISGIGIKTLEQISLSMSVQIKLKLFDAGVIVLGATLSWSLLLEGNNV